MGPRPLRAALPAPHPAEPRPGSPLTLRWPVEVPAGGEHPGEAGSVGWWWPGLADRRKTRPRQRLGKLCSRGPEAGLSPSLALSPGGPAVWMEETDQGLAGVPLQGLPGRVLSEC